MNQAFTVIQEEKNDTKDRVAIQTLLNCYLREIPNPLTQFETQTYKKYLYLSLSNSKFQTRFEIISTPSCLGSVEIGDDLSFKLQDSKWFPLTAAIFAEALNQEMTTHYNSPPVPDFLDQIHDSLRVTALISKLPHEGSLAEGPAGYILSEQSLVHGHPYHPSPKSRAGFTNDEVKTYSPEFKPYFNLHYFKVKKDFLLQDSLEALTADELVISLLKQRNEVSLTSEDFILPTHPWQARFLQNIPEVQQSIRRGEISYLGEKEPGFFPTASVRTLFSPASSYFYKTSLDIRITNCFRRNTLEELQASVLVTRLIRNFKLSEIFPCFHPLEEPAYLSVDLKLEDKVFSKKMIESFGMILRKNFISEIGSELTPILAGSIFGNQGPGRRWISELMKSPAEKEQWFRDYFSVLLPPLFYLFFEYGIMFEPHLQNIVIGLIKRKPEQIFIRDFDNVRVMAGSNLELEFIHDHLTLSYEEGWNRFIYCLFVNHLGEAIYQAAFLNSSLEKNLWQNLKDFMCTYLMEAPTQRVKNGIQSILKSPFLPGKTNLITRFQRTPDRKASYVNLKNPLF